MDILQPPRIDSLESQSIRVILHTAPDKTETHTISDVYMFQSVFVLKQRIMMQLRAKEWAPEYVFIALADEDNKYKPVEFMWDFSSTMENPYTHLGHAREELYKDDEIQPVVPNLFQGLLLKNALGAEKEVHIWSAALLYESMGRNTNDDVFYGYFRYYFPLLEIKDSLVKVTNADNSWFTESVESAQAYFSMVNERFSKLNEKLPLLSPSPFLLRMLRKLRYDLPKKELYSQGLFEQHFYEMKPTAQSPFIRFFPSAPSLSPLVKMAAGTLQKKELFESYMADESPINKSEEVKIQYSVILIKSLPVPNTDNVCWTICIYENGTADLTISASRRDRALLYKNMEDAFAILPEFLRATVWGERAPLKLSELSAQYLVKVTKEGDKPTQRELDTRYDVIMPLFRKEQFLKNAWVLRYKAVDNFIVDMNPVIEYITFLYLSMNKSVEAVNFDEIQSTVTKEFGIPIEHTQQYIELWRQRFSEDVVTKRDEIIKKYNSGTLITFQNDYPEYKFNCFDIQSMDDLQRILSLLSVFVYTTSAEFGINKTPPADAKELAQEQEQTVATEMSEEDLLFAQMMGIDVAPAVDVQKDEQAAEAIAANAPPVITRVEKEFIPNIDEEATLLNKLQSRNIDLFKYEKSEYGTTCQASANRQPNVMTAELYMKARRLYGNDVFWVEAPLEDNDVTAMKIASTTVKERSKAKIASTQTKYMFKDIVAFEKRALQLGFYLKDDESVLFVEQNRKDVDAYVKENPDAIQEMRDLIAEQKKKPLWTVIRAGTNENAPNYYVCAEYWCLREEIPLIPDEFKGTQYRANGKLVDGKPSNTCPFCEGKLVKVKKVKSKYVYYDDEGGATVIQRLPAQSSDKVAIHPGYIKLTHPDKFAQPCCFLDYKSFIMPTGAKKAPNPIVELPAVQRGEPVDVLPAQAMSAQEFEIDENIDRPFSPLKLKSNAKNTWYICNQIVLGRRSLEYKDLHDRWISMTRGSIAVPPREVNELLGQDPEVFLTKNKGVRSESANSKLMMPGHAFIRYGLGITYQNTGENAMSFLAFANYVIDYMLTGDDDKLSISSNAGIERMFEIKEPLMFNAFIQANYGTLYHEFSLPGQSIPAEDEMKFQRWRESKGLMGESQRAFAVQAYLAWNNFKNYMTDEKAPKDLRLLETLFTCQGLFSTTGFVLVKIKLTKEGPAIIECPKFGISLYSQKEKPPIIFVVENELTGFFDPLVFYEGRYGGEDGKEEIRTLFGAIQPYGPQFNLLSEPVRAVLRSFYDQYYGGVNGCGRMSAPIHPWIEIEEKKDALVPRLSELVAILKTVLTDYSDIKKLVRDRSNRLVGVIIKQKPYDTSPEYYIPCVDDGCVLMRVPSVFGEEALPLPPMDKLIAFLVGKQSKLSPNRIAHHFPGLKPKSLVFKDESYVGIKLDCQAIVPFKPVSLSQDIKHAIPDKTKATQVVEISEFPWEIDIALLGPTIPTAETVDFTDEEVLEEAYEHIRISFSNWLHSREGKHAKKQIELLRQARKRLPLYELQKRLDILIYPFVHYGVTQEGSATPSILRRDCLQIRKESDCVGSCTFSDGRCLIHAKGTQRYVDPVRVLTARLTDELLRTFRQAEEILQHRVSLLRPHSLTKGAVVHEGDTVLFSATGRGDESLYKQLGFTDLGDSKYKSGLTYPEETDVGTAADGAYKNKSLQFAADLQRDTYARLTALWPTITGTDDPLPEDFRGTDADWQKFANYYRIDIFKTSMGPGGVRNVAKLIKGGYQGAGEHTFIMLDVEGVPVPILTETRLEYRVRQSKLPEELQEIVARLNGEN